MRGSIVFLLFVLLVATAILVGSRGDSAATAAAPAALRPAAQPERKPDTAAEPPRVESDIPHIGSVRVLNGCGVNNAANEVADYLRDQGFDVKDVDNAPSWNYPHTIVVSRTVDMRNAEKVAKALSTERAILLRTEESLYDVVVYVGADFKERIP